MTESFIHAKHDEETKQAFCDAGCTPRKFLGAALQEKLVACGHSHMGFDKCSCRKGITKTLEQEWKELDFKECF